MTEDIERLSLTELIRLQEAISRTLGARFTRSLALAFTDIVGSTAYFSQFGDEAGRRLQQRHVDLLQQPLSRAAGRLVDTAGDGAFTCFSSVEQACAAMTAFLRLAAGDNAGRPAEHALQVRVGIHFGPVLTDGVIVSGDAVNLASRIAASAEADQVRLSAAAFRELASRDRPRCKVLGAVPLKGLPAPTELYAFEWGDASAVPSEVRVEQTGQVFPLPSKQTITFGRLRLHDGTAANDVVLELPDAEKTLAISRWHFELRRQAAGFRLRVLTDQLTEVNGAPLSRGQEAPVRAGTVVNLGNAITLHFQGAPHDAGPPDDDDSENTQTLSRR